MNDRLANAIDRLKGESANPDVPPEIGQALLAEFDRVKLRKRSSAWLVATSAFAASIAAIVILEHRPPPKPPASSTAVSAEVRDVEQPFVPIPYVTPLAPYERADIVRVDVPVSALIAAGLPMRTTDPGARAEADVVIGQDGRARAVRLISISTTGE